ELATGGRDVAAARRAHRRRIAGGEDDVGERRDRRRGRTFKGRARPWIERDQVDLGGDALEEAYQFARLGRTVVDPVQHYVFEGDAPSVTRPRISPAGVVQFPQLVFLVERHEPVAQLIGDGVQRHREIDPDLGAATM